MTPCPTCGHPLEVHGGSHGNYTWEGDPHPERMKAPIGWCCAYVAPGCRCTIRRWEHGVTADDVAAFNQTR